MLDSLVRVSRRVGGIADLLATEMQTAPAFEVLGIRVRLATRRDQSQERRARPNKGTNFTPALGPVSTVRRVNDPRNAAADRRKDPAMPSFADRKHHRAPQPSAGTSDRDFENASVYHYAVSRTLELSLQSSFQLSLTVLVRYRSRGRI